MSLIYVEEKTKVTLEEIAWSRDRFDQMKLGGTWAVPRSGLVFQRTGKSELTLFDAMPHIPEMPCTKEQLIEFQTADYRVIAERFTLAGISVKSNVSTITSNDG
jgi:hypothetical protein